MHVEKLVRTINDNPDPLHGDFTPSVYKLIELGLPGALAVLDLLDLPESMTRVRAQRVLEGVAMTLHGWVAGQGYQDPEGSEKTATLLRANGGYQASDPSTKRKQAIEKWRRWLEAQAE